MKKSKKRICKHCNAELPEGAKVCPECGKKVSHKLVWGIVIAVVVVIAAVLILVSGNSNKPPKEKEYVKEDQIGSVFTNPDKYKDKYIKIKGQVFNVEEDNGTYVLQVWYDIKDYDKNFIVVTDKKFENEDYISVDGWITGEFTGENVVGGKVSCPQIQAVSVEKTTYQDVAAPTVKEITVNKTSAQHGVKVTVEKVEFAEEETRIYVKAENDSSDTVNIYAYAAEAIQDGKQIGLSDESYMAGYDELEDTISAGSSDTGIILFKKMDPDKSFKLQLGAYSDNYNITMNDFTFDIQ